MADLDAILARLERLEGLEAENTALRRRLAELDGPASDGEARPVSTVSRRGLLRRAGSGAAALGVGALGISLAAFSQPGGVRADGEAITVGGSFADAGATTTIRNHVSDTDVFLGSSSGKGVGVHGFSGSGDGVFGDTTTGNGVHGKAYSDSVGAGVLGESSVNFGVLGIGDSGVGVQGQSKSGDGVVGGSHSGVGVRGFSDSANGVNGNSGTADGVNGFSTSGRGVAGGSSSGDGVVGLSSRSNGVLGRTEGPLGVGVRGYAGDDVPPGGAFGTGVLGSSGSHTLPVARANTGVMGVGIKGRGGVFIGGSAQIQLVPSSTTSHPASGARGDLYVDKSGRLWFCKGGSSWKQLA